MDALTYHAEKGSVTDQGGTSGRLEELPADVAAPVWGVHVVPPSDVFGHL